MNNQAKQIIGILESGGRVGFTDFDGDDSLIFEHYENRFFGRYSFYNCENDKEWISGDWDYDDASEITNIHPLSERREYSYDNPCKHCGYRGEKEGENHGVCQSCQPEMYNEESRDEEFNNPFSLGSPPVKGYSTKFATTGMYNEERREEEEIIFNKEKEGVNKELWRTDENGKETYNYPQIAKAAIEQAVEGSYKRAQKWKGIKVSEGLISVTYYEDNVEIECSLTDILINKDFLKAFYGTHKVDKEGNEILKSYDIQAYDYYSKKEGSITVDVFTKQEYEEAQEAWKHHLHKQIDEDNMLDYIGKHLK